MAKVRQEGGVKKGAPHHFTGAKRVWLDARAPGFHLARCAGVGEVAIFYDDVTRDFLVDFPKHGLALGEESVPSPMLPADGVDGLQPIPPELQPPVPELSQLDADASSKIFEVLRTVSFVEYRIQNQKLMFYLCLEAAMLV